MLFNPILLMIYVPVCALVGLFGRNRSIGFSGIFTLSLIVSPVVMALVLLVTSPKTVKKST